MKPLFFALPLALALSTPAAKVLAQDSDAGRDMALGAIAGAIIGHQDGRGVEGAAIGAGAGLLVNTLSANQDNSRRASDRRMTSTVVGGVAGAVIGKHNGNTAAGALIGSAIGYVLGGDHDGYVAVRERRPVCYEAPRRQVVVVRTRYVEPAPVVYVAPCAPATQTVIIQSQPDRCDDSYRDGESRVIVVQPRRAVVVQQRPVYLTVTDRDREGRRDHDRDHRRDRDHDRDRDDERWP